jgi:hypothetical protein
MKGVPNMRPGVTNDRAFVAQFAVNAPRNHRIAKRNAANQAIVGQSAPR